MARSPSFPGSLSREADAMFRDLIGPPVGEEEGNSDLAAKVMEGRERYERTRGPLDEIVEDMLGFSLRAFDEMAALGASPLEPARAGSERDYEDKDEELDEAVDEEGEEEVGEPAIREEASTEEAVGLAELDEDDALDEGVLAAEHDGAWGSGDEEVGDAKVYDGQVIPDPFFEDAGRGSKDEEGGGSEAFGVERAPRMFGRWRNIANSSSEEDEDDENAEEDEDDCDGTLIDEGGVDFDDSKKNEADDKDGVENINKRDELEDLTVVQLEEKLRAKGLKVGGKKFDLIDRLMDREDERKTCDFLVQCVLWCLCHGNVRSTRSLHKIKIIWQVKGCNIITLQETCFFIMSSSASCLRWFNYTNNEYVINHVPFRSMAIFGDSFSDVGNIHYASNGSQPSPWSWEGRYSDGRLWHEYVARFFQLPQVTPSTEGGTNITPGAEPLWTTQMATCWGSISRSRRTCEIIPFHPRSSMRVCTCSTPDITTIGVNVAMENVRKLYDAGARQFLVANVMNMSTWADAQQQMQETLDAYDILVAGHNQLLSNQLSIFKEENGDATMYDFNVFNTFECLITNERATLAYEMSETHAIRAKRETVA
ncbi:hypothetical protein ACHAWF_006494 [Thalassiosira exigua]